MFPLFKKTLVPVGQGGPVYSQQPSQCYNSWSSMLHRQLLAKARLQFRTLVITGLEEYDPFLKGHIESSCGELLFQGELTKEPVQAGLKSDIPLQILALGQRH